jgi:hypothetical protein
MRTHQIRVSDARESVQDIRHRLFTFPEVLEVFATGRSDVLVVVHTGRPRLGTWLAALRAVGYRTPPSRDATARPESISAEPPADQSTDEVRFVRPPRLERARAIATKASAVGMSASTTTQG